VSWSETFGGVTFQEWIFFYKIIGSWGNTAYEELDYRQSFRGLTDAFLAPPLEHEKWNKSLEFAYDIGNFSSPQTVVHNLLAVLMLLLPVSLLWLLPALYRRYGPDVLLLLLCAAGFTALAVHWEPFYVEFWVLPALMYSLLLVLVCSYLSECLGRFLSPLGALPLQAAAVMTVLLLFAHNLQFHLAPYADTVRVQGVGVWKPEKYLFISAPEMYRHPQQPRQDCLPE
jgi:hypothetical protein